MPALDHSRGQVADHALYAAKNAQRMSVDNNMHQFTANRSRDSVKRQCPSMFSALGEKTETAGRANYAFFKICPEPQPVNAVFDNRTQDTPHILARIALPRGMHKIFFYFSYRLQKNFPVV